MHDRKQAGATYRIGISGSYGGMNLGDEAILEGILSQLRGSLDADVVVLSRNPEDTEERHRVRAVPIREMHKDEVFEELRRLDLLILGGGGILFDGLAEEFLRDVKWADELGVPVMVYAVGVGPLKEAEARKVVIESLGKAAQVTVREGGAKRTLHDLGLERDIEVTADPALLLEPAEVTEELFEKEGMDPDVPTVGFSAREPGPAAPDLDPDHYYSILANAADFMVERFDAQILFVPMERGENRDLQHSHAIIAQMARADRASVLKGEYTSTQMIGLIGRMAFAVGMRLHFLIFAAIQRVPFVALPYAAKVSGLLHDLDMPMPAISELNVGKLCAFLDRSWDTRERIVAKLEENMPRLCERARQTNRILAELVRSLTPKG